MSGIGSVIYTILLGWMRGLVDWIWSMVSSGGPGSVTQWFLTNWKFWLLVLIVGGLVVDWLMWVVRWRPYRLLFGRRIRHAPTGAVAMDGESWDQGVGYYEHETALDTDPAEWTELTLSTLSEIDPNWAGGVIMEARADTPCAPKPEPYYSEAYEEPCEAQWEDGASGVGYWDETPDELEAGGAAESPYYEDADMEAGYDLPPGQASDSAYAYEAEAEPYEPWAETYDETIFMPPAKEPAPAYGEPAEDVCVPYGDEAEPYGEPAEGGYEEPYAGPAREAEGAVPEDTSPPIYMRPGFWPGSLSFRRNAEESAPAREDHSATEEPDPAPKRRRRRGLREYGEDEFQDNPVSVHESSAAAYTAPEPDPSLEDTRPRRLVRPAAQQPVRERMRGGILRTVTGKPAQRRGLMRFTAAEEEPIAGLPPMDLTDPFLPAARPGNPDFTPDEGEEFFTEGD
ncbi:MAG: hypothetical protein FWF69_10360 [Firmicutes bacterium]|nr:hypothetical protein [Bacillota bacterium]